MGAAGAMALLDSCTRMPMRAIVPYVDQPENLVPGNPVFYASTFVHRGIGTGVLVETHENRPTKIEGNPDHPASLGASDPWMQASVLSLYDPDRLKSVTRAGVPATWADFHAWLRELPESGKGVRILTCSTTSPTEIDLYAKLKKRFPEMKIYSFEPVSGLNVRAADRMGYGRELSRIYRFDRARIVVSIGDDFLSRSDARVRYAREFANGRRVRKGRPDRSRLYVAEAYPSLAGAMADRRFPIKASDFASFAEDLQMALATGSSKSESAQLLSRELRSSAGLSLVLAAEELPPSVHRRVLEINEHLGNVGRTLEFIPSIFPPRETVSEDIGALAHEMKSGEVQALLVLGANPVYSAPADLDFASLIKLVPKTAHLSAHADETSQLCDWVLPQSHDLETWADARAYDGTASIVQPVIAPLYESKSTIEVIGDLLREYSVNSHDRVRDFWKSKHAGDFESFWNDSLKKGVVPETRFTILTALKPNGSTQVEITKPQAPEIIEAMFLPDPMTWDGRYANNAWLQELPRPMTQIGWDNVVALSPALAHRLGFTNEDVVTLKTQEGRHVEGPVFILPGIADQTVVLHLGSGRKAGGEVAQGAGFDAYPLRTTQNPFVVGIAEIKKTGRRYELASTQTHFNMEGREPVKIESLTYSQQGKSRLLENLEPPTLLADYPAMKNAEEAWAMSIDLNTCIGCKTCMIACQAENNIPVVGKEQVRRTREMHWVRVDTYFEGAVENPKIYFQPVPCMQCERAPCELVCPTAATNHSDDGLNQMVYNRCVGTRYCSNNCPYKVRRFNFLAYSKNIHATEKLQANPDVTIRSRGVMEKCTYCVQRIQAVRIDAERDERPIRDGEIKTACEAACPTGAIVFGNKNDAESRVAKLREEPLAYALLAELGTRPRTTYLARVEEDVT